MFRISFSLTIHAKAAGQNFLQLRFPDSYHDGSTPCDFKEWQPLMACVLTALIRINQRLFLGLRRHLSIESAFRTISFVIRNCINQQINLHENRSTTTARYSQPSWVGCKLCPLPNIHLMLTGWTDAGVCWVPWNWFHFYALLGFDTRSEPLSQNVSLAARSG